MFSRQYDYRMPQATGRKTPRRPSLQVYLFSWDWELWRLARYLSSLLHPLRNASLLVALVLTAAEAGQPEPWTAFLGALLLNLVALLVLTWLIGEVGVALAVAIDEWRIVLLDLRQQFRAPPRSSYRQPTPLTLWP